MIDNIFAMVPVEVLADKRLTLEQMRVLIALLSFRNKNTDVVWPGREALADRAGGMHITNISKATSALVKLGWLEKDGDGARSQSCCYKIIVPDVEKLSTVAESATHEIVADSATHPTEIVAESATQVVADSARGIEQTIEHTKKATEDTESARARAMLLEREVPEAIVDQWLTIRLGKEQQTTPDVVSQIAVEATVCEITLAEAIVCCVANNWAGFTQRWYAKHIAQTQPPGTPRPQKPSAGGDWRNSTAGIQARGAELGIEQLDSESDEAFGKRVLGAAWHETQRKAREFVQLHKGKADAKEPAAA